MSKKKRKKIRKCAAVEVDDYLDEQRFRELAALQRALHRAWRRQCKYVDKQKRGNLHT